MDKKIVVVEKNSFSHFGHGHPLNPTNSPPRENIVCSACNLSIIISSPPGNYNNYNNNNNNNNNAKLEYYTCKTCPFYLHKVCRNMPKKTQHPSHPNHHLTLQTSPPPPNKSPPLKCSACEGHIAADRGYYYSCEECEECEDHLCYHILCSALPLSLSVSLHTHPLKLTFSPPYNFRCDICGNPNASPAGWLYRCQICEFDTHLNCAISMRKPQPLPESLVNGKTLIPSSSKSASLGARRLSVDYYRSEVDEVMQLVTERSLNREFIRLKNPNENISGANIVCPSKSNQTEAKKNSGENQLTPVSEETSAAASFQLSDACFSIDLARSYSGYDAKNWARDVGANDGDDHSTNYGTKVDSNYGNNVAHHEMMIKLSSELISDSKVPEKKPGGYGNFGLGNHNYYSFNMGRDERLLTEAFLVRNDTLTREELEQLIKGKKGKVSYTNGKSTTISHKGKSSGSSWQKRLICFCYTT